MRTLSRIAILAVAVLVTACSGDADKKAGPPPVPVVVAKAVEHDMPVTLQVVGRAEAFEGVSLKSRVDGQVAAVLFTEGQHVKQGDVLIRLDPTDFAAKLKQAEATVARDQALVAKTRADTARYKALREKNFVSEEKVNDVRTNEAATSANLQVSKAAAELARAQFSYTMIRAPFAGVVGARLVYPGSSVKINETTLAVVNRLRPLLVTFAVPERHLPRLQSAMGRSVNNSDRSGGGMTVKVSVPGNQAEALEGRVRFLDNAVDPATGTIQMKAELPNEDEQLTPGQFLNVTLLLDTLPKAVTVPNEAIQQGSEGNFVFVVKDDESVEIRKIETAAADARLTAVAKGLQAGETVVIDGQLRLTAGSKVKIKEAPAASTNNTPAAAAPATPSAPAK